MDKQQNISCEIHHSFDGLDHLRTSWDALVEEISGCVFQTYDWCRIWWKYYGQGRKLFIFLFRQDAQLVGILPLFAEKIWLGPVWLNVLKMLNCDHTYSASWPAIRESFIKDALRLIFERLDALFCWEVLLLDSLPGIFDAKAMQLQNSIRDILPAGVQINAGKPKEQTYFFLPKSYEQYIQAFDKKKQHELRRKKRILDEAADMADSLSSRMIPNEQIAEGFEAFYHAHQKHWQQQNRTGHFGDWTMSKEFHSELAQTMAGLGRLRLLEVCCGDEPIGYKYAYRFGKIWVEFLDARIDRPEFDRASLGSHIFLEQVKSACSEGVEVIDSLTGRFEHKLQMGGKLLPSQNLMIYRTRSYLRMFVFQCLADLLNKIYYKCWFCRICPRYGIARRPLWKSWIRSHMLAR